jgi:hypothetical protein
MFYHYKLYFGFRQMKTSLRLQIPASRGKRPALREARAYLGRRSRLSGWGRPGQEGLRSGTVVVRKTFAVRPRNRKMLHFL